MSIVSNFHGYPQCGLCGVYAALIHVCPRTHRSSSVLSAPPLAICRTCLGAAQRQDWALIDHRRRDFTGQTLSYSTLMEIWETVEVSKIYSLDYGVGAV